MILKPILMITHVTASDSGQIPIILNKLGYRTDTVRLNKGETLPQSIDTYSGFVIFGGPMSANDDHLDYIRAELDWIPKVMQKRIPLLGVCLGAQIMARSLGAKVAPHAEGIYEFGYYPVKPVLDSDALKMDKTTYIYHRHGEEFEMPAGSESLATRPTFRNQAFRYDETNFALQFHAEVNDALLSLWLNRKPAPVDLDYKGAQTVSLQVSGHKMYQKQMHRWLEIFLQYWITQGN